MVKNATGKYSFILNYFGSLQGEKQYIASDQMPSAGEYTFEQEYVVNNCDSILTLHLTVYQEYEVDLQDVICEGDGYYQHGFSVSAAQTLGISELEMTQNLQSQHTCDSVVNLHLTVVDTSIAIVSLTSDFCEEYSAELSVETNMLNYLWSNGESSQTITVNQPGTYTVTATQDQCSVSAWYQIETCVVTIAKSDMEDAAAIRRLGEGWTGEEAWAISLYCALRHIDCVKDAIIAAVNHNGDSDSTGSITGNIMGAIYGYEAIKKDRMFCPEGNEFEDTIELANIILALSDDLVTGCNVAIDDQTETPEQKQWTQRYWEMKPVGI